MGLSRDIREINRQILTDKQEKQLARQERQQLKDLQLLEQAQKQHLQLYLRNKIQYYLDLNFAKYKNDLYLLSLKNEIQQDFINKNKEYIDIVFIYFDEFYYKELKKQIKIYEMNSKALTSNTPPLVANSTNNHGILRGLFWFIFTFVNLLNLCLAGFKTNKRRF